ncbi:hypothetical protein [Clostridium sp. UBA4548]|uniref:hypothetical protein n=1 Tax=Clostridium sp. UBA4548 TaxID=1946361 RepID=UPI0025BD911B|nr:hypothetical protein [Clostridium sp. UBA4548]
MITLGKFWGIICIILSCTCFLKFIVHIFYYRVIRGLSKRGNRKLIDNTKRFMKVLEKNHGLCGIGALLAGIIHVFIMYSNVGFSFSGFLAAIALSFVIFLGIINKFSYKNKKSNFTQYHVIGAIAAIIFILLHINLN